VGNNYYKHRHREQGLCVDCSRPAMSNRIRCKHHLKQGVLHTYKKRQHYKQLPDRCNCCGRKLHEDFDTGKQICYFCRRKEHRLCF